jgi:PAS domain S-box-containing protein
MSKKKCSIKSPDCKSCSKIEEARKKTRQYKEYFEQIMCSGTEVHYRRNLQTGVYDFLSPKIENVSGFTRDEFMQFSVFEFSERVHPDDREKVGQILNDGGKAGKQSAYDIRYRFKRKNGQYCWMHDNFTLFHDDNGKASIIVGSVHDITEVKELYETLENTEERYRNLYNNARVPLYRTRISDGKVVECNQTLARMLGYDTVQQCLDGYVASERYVDPSFRARFLEELQNNQVIHNVEAGIIRNDKSICWLRISARIYPDSGYIEGAAWDITAAKLLTKIEMKVLTLVMQGLGSAHIAKTIGRSKRTIEDQRSSIMRKLGVSNLVELTKRAVQMGITPD